MYFNLLTVVKCHSFFLPRHRLHGDITSSAAFEKREASDKTPRMINVHYFNYPYEISELDFWRHGPGVLKYVHQTVRRWRLCKLTYAQQLIQLHPWPYPTYFHPRLSLLLRMIVLVQRSTGLPMSDKSRVLHL